MTASQTGFIQYKHSNGSTSSLSPGETTKDWDVDTASSLRMVGVNPEYMDQFDILQIDDSHVASQGKFDIVDCTLNYEDSVNH